MSHASAPAPDLPPTLFLTDADVGALADWPSTVDALRRAYAGPVEAAMVPNRTMARLGSAWLRSLTAVSPSGLHMGSKLIAASPQAKCASYLISLFEMRTMRLAALIDGNQVTGMRTAATTAVAIDALAPLRAMCVAMLGSGFEAHGQLEALAAIRDIELVKVYSPNPASRQRFVDAFAKLLPQLRVQAAASAQEAVQGSDVVICAARSHDETPILLGEWLRPGMTVASIGSTLPEQREVDAEVIRRADLIVCDMLEEVVHDTGDLIIAKREGVSFDNKIVPLADVAGGRHPGRPNEQAIVLFKSVGSALQDVVTAEMLLARALERGVGTPMPVSIAPVVKWK